MASTVTALSCLPKAILAAVSARGIESDTLLRSAGIDARSLGSKPSRIPDIAVRRLWALAVERTGDPSIGLDAAGYTHSTSFHSLGFAWLASPTLRDFLKRLVRYERVLISTSWVFLDHAEGRTAVRVEPTSDQAEPVDGCRVDAAFATLNRWFRQLSGDEFAPLAVEFCHGDHNLLERYTAVFDAPLRFGAPANRFWLSDSALGRALPAANPVLAAEVDRITEAYLATLADDSTAAAVRKRVLHLLPQGEADLKTVAAQLEMSPRSLQRTLRGEGHHFRDLVDDTRRSLATQFVAEGSHTLTEIAFRLGFADQSAFSKAFKRWTGANPSVYTAAHRGRRTGDPVGAPNASTGTTLAP